MSLTFPIVIPAIRTSLPLRSSFAVALVGQVVDVEVRRGLLALQVLTQGAAPVDGDVDEGRAAADPELPDVAGELLEEQRQQVALELCRKQRREDLVGGVGQL